MIRPRTRPSVRPRPPRPVVEQVGPFKGMRTTLEGALDRAFAEWLHNCATLDPYAGGPIIPRPGRVAVNTAAGVVTAAACHIQGETDPAAAAQRKCQMLAEFWPQTASALRRAVAIMAGKFYCATNNGAWVEAVNAATFAAAGITLDANATFYATVFTGKLVVVGPTVAFTWDGTTNGGITKLTNAGSSFYGRPTVYAGKLFVIKGDRKSILWSEEGNPTIGYEAGGYANAWDLVQTSQDVLTVIIGTNTALYYLRQTGIGAIYGGSAAEFQTTATHDAVSHTLGTATPDATVLAGDAIWFADDEGRPHYFLVGSTEIVPIWRELSRAFTPYLQDGSGYLSLAAPNAENARLLTVFPTMTARFVRGFDLVLFGYQVLPVGVGSGLSVDLMIGFHAATKRAQTVWTFPTPTAAFCEAESTVIGGSYELRLADVFGYTYALNRNVLAPISQTTWDMDRDWKNGTLVDVMASVIGPRHFASLTDEVQVSLLHVNYLGLVKNAAMTVRWATPNVMARGGVAVAAESETLTLDGLVAASELRAAVGLFTTPLDAKITVGLREQGRWIAFGFSWAHATRLRLLGWQVEGVPAGAEPRAY